MPLNTVSIYDLHSKLATVQTRIQCAVQRISKYQALPESDPKRQTLIRLAYMVLDQHQATARVLVHKLKEAEIAEAEQLLAVAQSPAVRAALEAEIEHLHRALALIAD